MVRHRALSGRILHVRVSAAARAAILGGRCIRGALARIIKFPFGIECHVLSRRRHRAWRTNQTVKYRHASCLKEH
jgi:hypothetical protein